ncbi:MAG: DNA primase [Anaerolineae bacterium]|nr:DNA primase [Anaerolineae bacterium]
MSAVDEVKQRLDIVQVISAYVPLKKAGRNYKGLCPFHNEKTASFIVFPDSQRWHCFGACGTGGDVVSFVMKRENLSFGEALKLLAARAGVQLQPPTPQQEAEAEERRRLWDLNRQAAEYFHRLLIESSEGAAARRYLEQRGLRPETLRAFQVGYARDDWQALGSHLKAIGWREEELLRAGLVIEREDGSGTYDRFRGRIIFPIRDARGRVCGFGGRVLGQSEPKYLNTPQTPVFDKGSVLFGIDLAREAIRRAETAVLVEGYMDVLMAHQAGFRNVVATMGTALSREQLAVLKPLARRVVLALDPDVAGDRATLRGLEVARESLETRVVPVPTARGLIRYETELEAELRILSLPEGRDPDEVIREDPARWEQLVADAMPVMDYYFKALTAGLDLSKAKDKAAAAEALLPLIAEVTNGIERAHHLQRLAAMLRTDERVLAQQMERHGRERRRRTAPPAAPVAELDLEGYLLYLLLLYPELVESVADQASELFLRTENAAVFATLRESNAVEGPVRAEDLSLDDALRGHVESVLTVHAQRPALSREEAEEALRTVALRLQRERLKERDRDLQAMIQAAIEEGDSEALRRYGAAVDDVAVRLRELAAMEKARALSSRRALREW